MKVLLRADGGVSEGTGHVVRCLTLGDELRRRGHQVVLMSAPVDVEWLREAIAASGIRTVLATADTLDLPAVEAEHPDWVVVDSYRVPSQQISRVDEVIPVLAIIDGDDRGILATLYLDQNLGAADLGRTDRLAGERYGLVRQAIVAERRADAWRWEGGPPSTVVFLGGSDPTDAGLDVAHAIADAQHRMHVLMIAPERQHSSLRAAFAANRDVTAHVIPPTLELPRLLGAADLVISAAGTSAWDICTIGIPAILLAVVDNQQASLREAVERGVALGVDAIVAPDFEARISAALRVILDDAPLRRRLTEHALATFDGRGAERVVDRMERRTGRDASW